MIDGFFEPTNPPNEIHVLIHSPTSRTKSNLSNANRARWCFFSSVSTEGGQKQTCFSSSYENTFLSPMPGLSPTVRVLLRRSSRKARTRQLSIPARREILVHRPFNPKFTGTQAPQFYQGLKPRTKSMEHVCAVILISGRAVDKPTSLSLYALSPRHTDPPAAAHPSWHSA